MHYIIQENIFKEEQYDNFINIFNKYKLDYQIVKIKPFVEELEYKEPMNNNVITFGSLKLTRLASKNKDFYPNNFLNKNHDYSVYSKYYKDYLLNYDSKIINFYDKNLKLPDIFFARPTKDNKAFVGKLYQKEDFFTMKSILKRNNWVKENFEIQISTPKKINSEARFWVIDGKIITGSYYRKYNNYHLEEIKNGNMWDFAQKMVDIYQIAESFVIDICLSNGKFLYC